MEHIYCDQAATSFPKPAQVVEAITEALTSYSASPGRSAHPWALAASRVVFAAREAMAELLAVADSSRVVFTLNVTQALNMALSGLLEPGRHVLASGLEHNSVMRPLNWLARSRGVQVEVVPADGHGRQDPADFTARLRPETSLVCVNQASNVTGYLAPVREIKAAVAPVPVLVDAAQSAGAIDLAPAGELADVLAFTGHKGLLGPTGTGGLWAQPGLTLTPLFQGGTGSRSEREEHPDFMPDALEAGTPNTHGLAGLAAGLGFIQRIGITRLRAHELELTRTFLDGLTQIREARVYGPEEAEARVAVVSLNLADWSPSDLARTLSLEFGIMTRPGLHCAPRAHRAIGTYPEGTVRFSFGWFNTLDEVGRVLAALDHLAIRRV